MDVPLALRQGRNHVIAKVWLCYFGFRSSVPARTQPQQTQPAPAPPAQAAPQQPGLFGQMAATAGGVAVGSAIGHTMGAAITGEF